MKKKVRERNIKLEVLVVLLVGALGIPGMYYIGQRVLNSTDADEMRFVVAARIIRPVLIIIALWIVYSIMLHFLSRYYNGRGPIRRVFKGTAWALLPLAIGNIIQSAALYLVFRDVDVSRELQGFSPADQMDSVLAAGTSHPIFIFSVIAVLFTVVWSGFLLSFVVHHAKGISREQSLKIASVLVLAQALLIIWAILQGTVNFAMLL